MTPTRARAYTHGSDSSEDFIQCAREVLKDFRLARVTVLRGYAEYSKRKEINPRPCTGGLMQPPHEFSGMATELLGGSR